MKVATKPTVGIRELRDHLSQWLERVKGGEELVVTDHGEPIATIVPRNMSDRIAALVASGKITKARNRTRKLPEPVTATQLSDLVADQRL